MADNLEVFTVYQNPSECGCDACASRLERLASRVVCEYLSERI